MKKTAKILVTLILGICSLLAFIPAEHASAADWSNGYGNWSQGQSDYHDMRVVGCLITAQAKMLGRYVFPGVSGDLFNPDVFFQWEAAHGSGVYLSNPNASNLNTINYHGPDKYAALYGANISYEGPWAVSIADTTKIWQNIRAGKASILKWTYPSRVVGEEDGMHFALVNNEASLAAGDIRIYQSGWTPHGTWSLKDALAAHPGKIPANYDDGVLEQVHTYSVPASPIQLSIANIGEGPFYANILFARDRLNMEAKFGDDAAALGSTSGYAIAPTVESRETAAQTWMFFRQPDGSYVIEDMTLGHILLHYNSSLACMEWTSTPPNAKWLFLDYGDHYEIAPYDMLYGRLHISGNGALIVHARENLPGEQFLVQQLAIDPPRRILRFDGTTYVANTIPMEMKDTSPLDIHESRRIIARPQTFEKKAPYDPCDATTNTGVTWSSSNPDVAVVDSNGVVTGVSDGTAVITAISEFNPYYGGQIEVTVETKCDHVWDEGTVVRPLTCTQDGVTDYRCTLCGNTKTETTPAQGHHYEPVEGGLVCMLCRDTVAVEAGWTEADTLPAFVTPVLFDIEYSHTYTEVSETSPGEGWTQTAEGDTYYADSGSVYESILPLETSETRVQKGFYYYHYCNSDKTVNFVYDASHTTFHTLTDASLFTVVQEMGDWDDSRYIVYRLNWASGQWAGGAATCPSGNSALYYRSYWYQDRVAVTENVWQKVTGWTSDMDESADSIRVRFRMKENVIPGGSVLVLPAGTVAIEAGAFDGDSRITEAVLPDGLITIGSEAFARCTALRLVRMPGTVTAIDPSAFTGSDNVVILCTAGSCAEEFARVNNIPYLTALK